MSFASICDILMNDHIPLISVGKFNDETEGKVVKKSLEKISNIHRIDVYRTFQMYLQLTQVSSWQKAEYENKDMWEQYTGKKEGVAIRTNAKLLLDCIRIPKDVMIHLPEGEKTKFSEGIIIKPVKYIRGEPSDCEITFEQIQDGNAKLCFFYKKKNP